MGRIFKSYRPDKIAPERLCQIDYIEDPGQDQAKQIASYIKGTAETLPFHRKYKIFSTVFATCDIEVTTLLPGEFNPTDKPVGIPYLFQFRLAGKNYLFRYKEQFRKFIDAIADELHNGDYVLVCYVHNLSYEYQFFKTILSIDRDSIFALQTRRIGKFTTNSGAIEWRCSYLLSNMSLEKFTENYCTPEFRKDKELIDYEIIRFPWSRLSNDIIYYSLMDVVTLEQAVLSLMRREDDSIKTIPMTNTGYVRRAYRLSCLGGNTKHYRTKKEKETYEKFFLYRRMFTKTQLTYEQYKLCSDAFRGGNTHANRFFRGADSSGASGGR